MRKLFQQLIIAFIDWSAILYLHILWSSLLSFILYIPFLPGIVITSLGYFLVSYCKWHKTLGMYIIPSVYQYRWKWLMIVQEIIASGSTLILLGYLYINFRNFQLFATIWAAIILIPILIPWFKKKIFGIGLHILTNDKNCRNVRRATNYYVVLFVCATVIRLVFYFVLGTSYGNAYFSPLVTEKYVSFLQRHRQNTLDYIFDLYQKKDHIILCERFHPEYTQWDLIYRIISDPRYSKLDINMFTEYGAINSQDDFSRYLNQDYTNDTIQEKSLARFLQKNTALWPIWEKTNWHDFLIKFYNLHKDRGLKLWFTDGPTYWEQLNTQEEHQELLNRNRDSLMASHIIQRIKKDSVKKSLIIMNFRHAFITPSKNCGYYLYQEFHNKMANVLIHSFSGQYLPQNSLMREGLWDKIFSLLPDSTFAFSFEGSPFGEDGFDYFPGMALTHKYKEMFTGFIYYLPLNKHILSYGGYPYILDGGFKKELERRNTLVGSHYIPSDSSERSPYEHSYFISGSEIIRDKALLFFSAFSVLFLLICFARRIIQHYSQSTTI